jgi:hypothetical protein
MSAGVPTVEEPVPVRTAARVPHDGWRVIAAKELGDHLLSVRFMVLLIILGLAAAVPLYFAPTRSRPSRRRRPARRPCSSRCSRSARPTIRS